MPRPMGGDWLADEIQSLAAQGVQVLVSLLTQQESENLQLEEEGSFCAANGIEFLSFPITDRDVPPQDSALTDFLGLLQDRIADGKAVAIHCWAGIGRSTIIASCLLISSGRSVEQIMSMISRARGYPVPDTRAQLQWVREFAARAVTENR